MLAWRRTVLALVVGPVVAARLLVPELGAVALAAVGGGLALGVLVAVASTKRHCGSSHGPAGAGDPHGRPGAAILLVTALVPLIGGILALALLLGPQ